MRVFEQENTMFCNYLHQFIDLSEFVNGGVEQQSRIDDITRTVIDIKTFIQTKGKDIMKDVNKTVKKD